MGCVLWKAADGAGLNPNPSVQLFLPPNLSLIFVYSSFSLFLLIFSHLPPAALSLFWVLAQKKAQKQQQNPDIQRVAGLFLDGMAFSLQGWPQDDAPSAVPVSLPGFISAQTLQGSCQEQGSR